MKKAQLKYNLINISIIFLTALLFVYEFFNVDILFIENNVIYIIIIATTACLVHFIKACRLYLALYGSDLKALDYIKTYCKVIPVGLVFPYKLGEFFRIYCYGKALNNLLQGIVTVMLDRFMDTMALVTIILILWVFNGGHISVVTYVLLLFLLFALLLYFLYPGIYLFWKKYFLKANATERKLVFLKVLDALNNVYREICNVLKGRGIVLYFLSLIAWAMEIGSLTLLCGIENKNRLNDIISQYLLSAIGVGASIELKRFVFISIMLLMVVYCIIKIYEVLLRKGARNEGSSNI